MPQGLTESEREALVIRWRRILILGLIDFFNGTNDFGKLIIKELVDMREAVIKAFARCLGISLHSGNSWRRFNDILSDIYKHPNVSEEIKNKLQEIDTFFTSNQFTFQQFSYSLKDLRNEETHYLNLSDLPKETIIRVWRMFYKLIATIDPDFFDYTRNRAETRDFYFLQDFFKKVVLEGNLREETTKHGGKILVRIIDLDKIRKDEDGRERGIYEMIEFIKSGGYLDF
jgi:hypothetical protein